MFHSISIVKLLFPARGMRVEDRVAVCKTRRSPPFTVFTARCWRSRGDFPSWVLLIQLGGEAMNFALFGPAGVADERSRGILPWKVVFLDW